MLETILRTGTDWSPLVLRLTAGLLMLPHGLQKTFGLFGGYGFTATMAYFTKTMHLPAWLAFAVIVIESLGAVCLAAGFATRLWSMAFIAVMVGAIVTTNLSHGLFMNWYGTQAGEGYEYHLLMIGICLALLMEGGGRLSIDQLLQ